MLVIDAIKMKMRVKALHYIQYQITRPRTEIFEVVPYLKYCKETEIWKY